MKLTRRLNTLRFFSSLTILSFTFTQVVPAWALRPAGVDSEPTKAGLEEALQDRSAAGASAASRGALSTVVAHLLTPRAPRGLNERIAALESAYGKFESPRNRQDLPAAATDLMRRLALSVSDGVLRLDEASDPMLALTLLAPKNRGLQETAKRTVQAWETLYPNCAEHALHETLGAGGITIAEHDALDLLSAVATALDLFLLNGKLRGIAGVQGVDHPKEIARTAQTVEWLHQVVGRPAATPVRVNLTRENLARLAGLDVPVIALVSHTRTPGWNADHYVSLLHVDPEADAVVYLDNGQRKTDSINDFVSLHRPSNGQALLFLNAESAKYLSRKGLQWRPLSAREMTTWSGACGIILHVGRYSQEGGLAAAFDAAYRGKDNTGEIVVEPTGLRRVTVQGSPSDLVRSFQLLGQGYPEEAMTWYLEANPDVQVPSDLREALMDFRSGGILTDRQRYLIHRKWRNLTPKETVNIEDFVSEKSAQILREQGLGWVRPQRLDVMDLNIHQMRPAVKDDLYQLSFYGNDDEAVIRGKKKAGDVRMDNAVGRGKRGYIWSGRWISMRTVPPDAAWQVWRQALSRGVEQIQGLYRYNLTAIREILRYELADILERQVAAGQINHADAARMEVAFVRHFEQVWIGQSLKPEEEAAWKAAWSVLASEPVHMAGHVSPDPVRQAFRIQGALIASILRNPSWAARVGQIFIREVPDSRKNRDWYDDWRVESNTNTPGRAFAAVTEWFQERYIPPDQREKIEIGQMDALTLSYMHIVDRKLRHDRWATTGSRIPKDAQPVTDTGLLSNVDSKALRDIMAVVRRSYEREVRRASAQTAEQKTNILRHQFLLILRDYLERHPEMRGAPARGFAHNGDLSPDVQNGILPLLRANGYVNEQIRVDAEKGETRREQILTDTWKLGALVEFIYDQWRKDRALGGVLDAEGMAYVDTTSVGFMPPEYRALWNSIQTTLQSQQMAFTPEELAQRIALLEFARGVRVTPGKASSEIALGWISLYDPALDGVVSHRRAVELVVARSADGNFQVQYTSDALTALRMFNPQQVESAIQNDTRISAEFRDGIYDLLRRRKLAETNPSDPQGLSAEQFQQEMRLRVARVREEEKQAGTFQAELSLTLKGEQKYVKVRKRWYSPTNRFEPEIDITNFEGHRLATIRPGHPDEIDEAETNNIKVHRDRDITIAAASKGGFPTFGLKEIDSELSALALMHVFAGVRGEDPSSLDITAGGLKKTAQELEALLTPAGPIQSAGMEEAEGGLNQKALASFLANAIKTGRGTNVFTGVGSSENDSSAARALFRYLLPQVGYDNITPARLISTAAHYDSESTLAGGITWSGTTALTLLALQWLQSQGVAVSGVTGNPAVKDLADIVDGSAGTVHARTKKEVAIYTTVGFLMLLEGLFEEAIQQNLIAQRVATDETVRNDLQRRLHEIWGDYASMVENLANVLGDPERDYFREGSRMSRAARRFSKFLGMRFIGDYYNNPIIDEIGIKVGETRNINFTSYDYRSYGYRSEEGKGGNIGWFLNATSLSRIREAAEVLKQARERGMSIIVQTFDPGSIKFTQEELAKGYDKDWEEFNTELEQLERDFSGEGENPLAVRFTVPRVHFTLQPMLDVITGQLFGVGLALAAGYSNEATDGPRNLAKSVTVLGVQLAFGALITLDQFLSHGAQQPAHRREEMASYESDLARRWPTISSAWEQGLSRLPAREAELLRRLRLERDFRLDEDEVQRSFGPTLGDLRRIVILYDTDEAAEVAGRMAGIPLSNSEVVLSDSQDDKLFAESKDRQAGYKPREIRRAINGREATIRFVRSQTNSQAENRISIQFDGESSPAVVFSGDERGILSAVQAQQGVDYETAGRTLKLAGRRYELQVLGKRGISLAATQPDLLGVPVEVHRPTDFTLDEDTSANTLVVAISRSNHRGSQNGEVTGIASSTGRNEAERKITGAKGVSEGSIAQTLQTLRKRGVPIFTVSDEASEIHTLATHGSALLSGSDLDSVSAVTQYYTALLLLGARLGAMRGVPDARDYERALDVVPNIEVRTLASLYTEEVETGTRLFWNDVAGVTVDIGHLPTTVSYTPDSPVPGQGVKSGTVQVTRGSGEAKQMLLELKVEVSNDEVVGIQNPQPQYLIGGRSYRVALVKTRGLVFQGVEPDYTGGGSLRDALVSLRQNRFGPEENQGKQYRSWGVIGGVQDRAGAAAIALALEQAGYQARHLEVDESVHGWYALINDAAEKKYPDLFFREGVSPDFNPDNMNDGQQEDKDVGIIILATDTRTFGASIVDAQRARTRNARIILVVKESDRNSASVVNAGAHLVITVPDAFNEMNSFSHELIGQVLARELKRSESSAYAYQPGTERAALALLPSVEMKDVAAQIRGGISPILQDMVETELEQRNRPPQQVDQLLGAFVAQRSGAPSLVVRRVQEGPYYAVYAAFPYREAGGDVSNPSTAIPVSLGVPVHDIFVTTFRETEHSQPIALLRLEMNLEQDAILAERMMAQVVAPYNAAAAVPSEGLPALPAVAPRSLQDIAAQLTARFSTEPAVHFDSEYDPGLNQTTLVVIGAPHQPGLLDALIAPLRGAEINILSHGPLADHGDVSYVVARGRLSAEVLAAITDSVESIAPARFSSMAHEMNPLITPEQIDILYSDFRAVQRGEASSVTISSSPYPVPPQVSSVMTIAVKDFPEGDPRRQELMGVVREAIYSNQRNIVGHPASGLWKGIRLIQLTLDNREGAETVRGAMGAVKTALAQLASPASGLEEQVLDRRSAIDEIYAFVQSEQKAGRTGVELIGFRPNNPTPMSKDSAHLVGKFSVEQVVDFAITGSGYAAVRYGGAYGNRIEVHRAAGLGDGRTYEIYRNGQWPLPAGTTLVHTGMPQKRYLVIESDERGSLKVVDSKTRENAGLFSKKDLFPDDQEWETSPLFRQIPPASAGLEESPLQLQLPDWMPAPEEVLGRIRQALQAGLFLRKIQELREMVASPKTNYRKLSADEQRALKARGVTAENWDQVTVPMQFGAEDIARMRDVTLLGTVRLGLLRGMTVVARDIGRDGTEQEERLPGAIERTTLENVIVGNGVFIKDNTKIRGYVIEEGAAVYDNGLVLADQGTTFGLGTAIPVGPEVGGREVKAYPEILLGDIARLARSRGDQSFQAEYKKEHDRYVAAARSDYGYIGKGAQLSGSHQVRNLFLSPGAQFMAVPDSRNVIVLSGPEDLIAAGAAADSPQLRASERTWVVGAQKIENVILQQGVKVASGAVVIGTSPENGVILLEHSHAENMATVKDSVIGPNTGIEKGEVTSSLMGPFIGMHHSSIVIGVDWAEGMGNVGAEAAIGSNHTSRAPDQELRAGEGTFFGLNSSYSFSGNYSEAPYSIFGKGVSVLPGRVQMPFSLVERPDMQLHGISPELMQISPGWVWSDNAYMPMRNEGKYANRDKTKRHNLGMGDLQRYSYEILRPSIVNQMIRARDVLRAIKPETAFKATVQAVVRDNGKIVKDEQGRPKTKEKEVRYYTSDQIPGLGKNFMTEEVRKKAEKTYSFMIEYYAFKGLLAEVQKRVDAGRMGEVGTLLETPSNDLRWEHERRTLVSEVPGITVTSALQTLVERQGELARRIWQAKDKDDQRGDRMLDDYGKTHISAENDKFVKQSAAAVQKLDRQVKDLVRRLELRIIEEKTGFSMRDVSQLFGDRKPATMTFYPNDGAPEPEATGVAPEDLTVKFQNAAFDVFQNAADARVAKYDVSILEHTDIPNPSPAVQALGGVHFKIVARRSGLEEGVQAPSLVDLGPATRFTGDVALTQTGKPILTVSALKAALTLVPGVPSAKLSSQQVFVVAPDGLAKFAAAVTVFGAGGVTAEIIARNAKHKQQVEAGLRELGLRNFTVHDLETEYAGDLGAAIEDVKIKLWQADQNTQVQVVTALTGLLEVEQFLGAAAAEGTLRAIEAIADRSNQVWS